MGGRADNRLHRVIYVSRVTDPAGLSTLALARILGAAERNNRRDGVTGCLMLHGEHIVQVLEGEPEVLARLLDRLRADARHGGLRVLVDTPVTVRRYHEPMALGGEFDRLPETPGRVDIVSLIARLDPGDLAAGDDAGGEPRTAFVPALTNSALVARPDMAPARAADRG